MAVMTRRRPSGESDSFDPVEAWTLTPGPAPASTPSSALDGILEEFAARWNRGEHPRAEDFLGRLRQAGGSQDDEVELIYNEFYLAESSGRPPDPDGYLRRFPEHAERLGRLFGLHQAIDSSMLRHWAEPEAPARLPGPGASIGPYDLERELGKGAFARVFLARQTDLADRPVVLKVSARASGEPQLMARARHPHIVEILRHMEANAGALHLIAMPFLGGATLSAVLAAAWPAKGRGRPPRSGRTLIQSLDAASDPDSPRPDASSPARLTLQGGTFAQGVIWLVARLAEALDHAHRRGVTHGDLKPTNVLIAADGRPMLLDFNLAVDWRHDEGPGGGTLAYMAPERLAALADPGEAPTPTPVRRHRADLYALGLILREALTGQAPELPAVANLPRERVAARLAESRTRPDSVRRLLAGPIPAGLRPILARLLAPDPADRYRRASDLVVDLDRWRTDRPLAYADEPPASERLARWTRRRRAAMVVGAIVLATGGLVALGANLLMTRTRAQQALDKLERLWGGGEPGVYRYIRWTADRANDPARLARILGQYGLDGPDAARWRDRDDVRALPDEDRFDLELWLQELTWRHANALAARPNAPVDWQRALASLDADPVWSALPEFARLRKQLQAQLGPGALATPLRLLAPPPDALAEYLSGVDLEDTDPVAAAAHFRRVLLEHPRSHWANYRLAAVSYAVGDFQEAADRLERCLERWTDNADLHTQLAGCMIQMGRFDRALVECDRALALDANAREAFRNRAILNVQLGRSETARKDVEQFGWLAESTGLGREWRWFSPSPVEPLEAPVELIDPDTRMSVASMLYTKGRNTEAVEQYDLIIAQDPGHVAARFYRASMKRSIQQTGGNVDAEAVIDSPRFFELYRFTPQAIFAFGHVVDGLLKQGLYKKATETALRGLRIARERGDAYGEASMYCSLGRAYAMHSKFDPRSRKMALDAYRSAEALSPGIVLPRLSQDDLLGPASIEFLQELGFIANISGQE